MRRCLPIVAFLVISLTAASAAIDRNGNGLSDIWEMIYGASALNPNLDSDGDGFSNLAESRAGTNPFDSNSFPHLTLGMTLTGEAQVSWLAFAGKRYTIQ